jgi:protoheme IX farnesyltransferase
MNRRILAYIELFKPRILALLVYVATVAAITASNVFNPLRIIILALAIAVASAGASILNHYFDRDLDAIMERTKNRPLPSGRIAPHKAFWLGLILLVISILVSSRLNYVTSLFIFLGALVYVLVYTIWLKRRFSANIVVGGAAGSFAVLAGFAAAEGKISFLALLVALLIFLWTPPHFWAFAIVRKSAYMKASIPMLPVTHGVARTTDIIFFNTLLLVQSSLLPYVFGYLGKFYLITAVIFGLVILFINFRLLFNPTNKRAWSSYKLSGIYLIAIFSGMLLDNFL